MVKRLPRVWNPNGFSVLFRDYTDGYPFSEDDFIVVHEYSNADAIYMIAFWAAANFPDQTSAALAALDLAAHPAILVDLSPLTHGSLFQGDYCPLLPRFNIYRNGHYFRNTRVYYWDWTTGPWPPE